MNDNIKIGKIVNTHGIAGEVKVLPYTDDINRFFDLEYVYLDNKNKDKLTVKSVRIHKNTVLVKFDGIESMNDAERIKGQYIEVDRDHAVKLPENSYFICDLLGCTVNNEEGDKLGILSDIIQTGSNDVYVIKSDKGELLAPAIKDVVKKIDIDNKTITIKPQEELE